ncbi:hypothetical protein ACRALDRAFT_1061126, partial [Sodiomyces alcalophilus JCM 7366]|uniref:uncharacterized protein n=1 Tax=Sodiomyces alcalophilus JCM 7366 TaxID=591952 RepID=UPI0039B39A91
MIPRSVQHVTRLMSQLPRRSFSSKAPPPRKPTPSSPPKRNPATSQAERIDPAIRKRLEEIQVETPEDIQTAWRWLPKTLNPKHDLRVRYLADRHFVKLHDKSILTPAIRPRSVQRLAYYRDRKATRALWLDIIAHQSKVAAVVVGRARRMCRVAMVRALRARGIHKHGWQLAPLDAYFAARTRALRGGKGERGVGADDGDIDDVQSKPPYNPVLRGTVWVNIIQPREFVALGMDRIQEIADGVVDMVIKAKANSSQYPKKKSRARPQQQEKAVGASGINGKGKKGHLNILDDELQIEAS